MTRKVSVAMMDDVDGSPGARTVTFGLDGVTYEIDLAEPNQTRFADALAPFIQHARKVGTRQRGRPTRTASSRARSGDIRAWAKGQGIQVSDRGRIPASVIEQYESATRAGLSRRQAAVASPYSTVASTSGTRYPTGPARTLMLASA